MSLNTEYAKFNIEAFGRIIMRYHRTLNPILTDGDNLEVFADNLNLEKGLKGLQMELKKQKMLLDIFERKIN